MIVVLNGPLGIGKSTLAEALSESIDRCVMLDGDALVAANPASSDPLEHLHSTIALLVAHHRRFGYLHFVIAHIWTSASTLVDLRGRLAPMDSDIRCFRLTLPVAENLARIERRASTRALDEREFEQRTFQDESDALARSASADLGEPFDVSASPGALVAAMLRRLGLNDAVSASATSTS